MMMRMPGAAALRRPVVLAKPSAFIVASLSVVMVSVAAGAPAPLNTIYADEFGVTSFGLTSAFAAYIVCAAIAMLAFGRLSDHLGRRPVGLLALAVSSLACIAFLFVDGTVTLVAGRAIQGIAVGIGMSALGAYVVDLAPQRLAWLGRLVASVAAPFGVASGAVLSGALVEYAPQPAMLVFIVVATVCALCGLLVFLSPETVLPQPGAARSLVPRIAVPARLRTLFTGSCACFVACWSVGGLYQSLGPSIARDVLALDGHLAGGAVAGSVIGATALGGLATAKLTLRRSLWCGIGAFAIGVAGIALALAAGSVTWFLFASVLTGLGFGATFSTGMRILLVAGRPSETAGLLSAVYLVGFLGSAVPGLVGGLFVDEWGLVVVVVVYCVAAGSLVVAGGVLVDRQVRRTTSTPSGGLADEFLQLPDVAQEVGVDPRSVPPVRRLSGTLRDGGRISALVWGDSEPEIVFLHGGGQNAHTWDLVAVRLGRPAVAIDLPGHGHSSWRGDRDYWPERNALAVAEALEWWAADAQVVVGMSLGGLTAISLAATRPDLVRRLVLVDITPRATDASARFTPAQRGTTSLLSGPREISDLDELIERVAAASPHRPRNAVARGVMHNVIQLEVSGGWRWRHDFSAPEEDPGAPDLLRLWDLVDDLLMPVTLAKGAESSHVTDADVAQLRLRLPGARVVAVPGAGHSIQSDNPRALARLLDRARVERILR
jgi:pimeloyl-ACP methyl ester carboxylesterase/predicted MFS family arabinose efflux permease